MLSKCRGQVDATGRELTEHGNTAFPFACYHDDLIRETVPWHWHDELEAAVVTEGEAVIAVDAERYRLKAGEGFFINSGVLHSCWNVDASACRFHSVVFHPRLVGGNMDSVFWVNYLQPVLEDPSLKSMILTPDLSWHRKILQSVEQAWQSAAGEEHGYEFEVRDAVSRIIFRLADRAGSTAGLPSPKALRDENRIKQMLRYIHAHYPEEISLEQIAECASVSESECLRCFRSMIGTTPIRYLKSYRLQRSAKLLEHTQERIVDIGVQCGFQDMSYFAKTFRKAYGCSPSVYRNRKEKERIVDGREV